MNPLDMNLFDTNPWSQLRLNIIVALQAIPALAGIPVVPIAGAPDVWAAIPEGTGIGVARRRTKWNLGEEDLNNYVDQSAALLFDVLVKTDSPVSNTDGLTGVGQSEALTWAALGVRDSDIGIPGVTGALHLAATDEAVVLSKNRAEGGAGPIAQVITFRVMPIAL